MKTVNELVAFAQKALKNAYAPYSNFHVGAAILMKDENVVTGANMENASYGLTVCAERNAIFAAYSQGYRKEDIVAMAIISDFDGDTSPCGACRQVLSEMIPSEAPIYMINKNMDIKKSNIRELLPFAFTKEDIDK